MDADWASEETLAECLELFRTSNMKCTIFATGESTVLSECQNEGLFEVGIHPNFNPLLKGQSGESSRFVIEKLLKSYPKAIGVRSHSMTVSTVLLQEYADLGLKYESNYFLPYQVNARPFKIWNSLTRIPYVWEDDVHWMFNKKFDDLEIPFDQDIAVFGFHPVHIVANNYSQASYEKIRPYYGDHKMLKKLANNEMAGARDALLRLFEIIQSRNIESVLMRDLVC